MFDEPSPKSKRNMRIVSRREMKRQRIRSNKLEMEFLFSHWTNNNDTKLNHFQIANSKSLLTASDYSNRILYAILVYCVCVQAVNILKIRILNFYLCNSLVSHQIENERKREREKSNKIIINEKMRIKYM